MSIACSSCTFFFFFNDTATTEIYTLSLHDALPICWYTVCPPPTAAQRPREGMVRIGFLMGRSFTEDRHQADIVSWLRQLGATADPLHLGDDLIDVARVSLDHDLFVLKSRSDLAMSVAADPPG